MRVIVKRHGWRKFGFGGNDGLLSCMITRETIRAARGLLGWSQSDLAKAADLKLDQVKNIERGVLDPRASMLTAIEDAFRKAGVIFLDRDDVKPGGPGVRFRR